MTQKEKVIQIAQGEIGYKEKANGWTKYGQWYEENVAKVDGFAEADWCNMFITWCMNQAGAMDNQVYPFTSPQGSACPYCLSWFEKKGCRTGADDMPQVGDLVFYRWNANTSYIDHIGIVEKVEGSSADNAKMTVIEGNKGNAVARRTVAYRAAEVIATVRPEYKAGEIQEGVKAPFEMSQGSKGDSVKILQMALEMKGYDVGADGMDGILGAQTAAAVKKFQKDAGIEVDGVVGTETWTKLCGV